MVSKTLTSVIKTLPKDEDAEGDYLGMCLLANKIPEIEPELFYNLKNREITETIQDLAGRDDPFDPVNVLRELKKSDNSGSWDNGKGAIYIAELVERVPCYVEKIAENSIKQITQTASLRKIIEFIGEIIILAQEPGANPVELAARIQSEAYKIEMPKSNLLSIKSILKDVLLNLEKRIEAPESMIGFTTGLRVLDNATSGGFVPGELWVVAGRPGMGKSALAWGMAVSVAKAGHKVLGISLEMGPNEVGRRFLSRESLISATKLRTGANMADSFVGVCGAADKLTNLPLFLEEKCQINEIELHRVISKMKPEVVFIDYLQLMTAAKKFNKREGEISHLTRSLKIMARTFGICVVVLSQLNRDFKGRTNKMPMLTDLRESGAIEQDADIVLGLYRDDEPEGEADLCILKNRNGKIGKTKVYWHGPTMNYRDLAF